MIGLSFPASDLVTGENVPDRHAGRRRVLARAYLRFLFLF
jgi:hypothetical protein